MAMATEPYILIVDDEEPNLFLMEELLRIEGYVTQSARSGEAAIAQAQRDRPQLILLDVMMPGMDGFEVCEQLRKDPALKTIPILFLTALDDDRSRLRGIKAMGDDYLTKPINSDLVLTKIEALLKLNALRNEAHEKALADQVRALQVAKQQHRQQMMAAWKISETLSEKFHLFVPEQFLNRIAPRGLESIQVGNATESAVTVLFCDIRDFTSIVETQNAQETFHWLNAFFEELNQAVTENGGFIDKYLGDAVMAVFDHTDCHVLEGVKAAIAMGDRLKQFNETRHQFGLSAPIEIGIGLHTGIGVIGTLGANQRIDPTVVGDVVNTASRLEEMTKLYRCQIIGSEAIIDQLPKPLPVEVRWLDQVLPRGKRTKMQIYEIIGPAEAEA